MSEYYNLNQLAMFTSLTTRTLRNYLNQGLLHGEKIDGVWSFTPEDVQAFLSDKSVRRRLESHRNAVVLDFLADTGAKQNRACVILDYVADDDEADQISKFYCDAMCRSAGGLEMRFSKSRGGCRVILAGQEDPVMDLLREYYAPDPDKAD